MAQVKEIIYPLGATIDIRQVALGDQTMSVLEIWGAEYQENDCLLIKPDDRALLEAIAARERCIMQASPHLHKPSQSQTAFALMPAYERLRLLEAVASHERCVMQMNAFGVQS